MSAIRRHARNLSLASTTLREISRSSLVSHAGCRPIRRGMRVALNRCMIAALFAFATMTAPMLPAPTRHFVLREGGHATVTVHHKHLRGYWFMRGGVASVERMRNVASGTVMTLVATSAGSTAITVNCDGGGKEVWLVDVR